MQDNYIIVYHCSKLLLKTYYLDAENNTYTNEEKIYVQINRDVTYVQY